MKSYLLVGVLLTLTVSYTTFGADISGTVLGIDGEGARVVLPKATVFWLGTNIGTITDAKGKFTLSLTKESNQLVTRYVGYEPDTLIISEKTNDLEIVLKSGFTTEEINVVGKQQSTLISQSSSVKTETITSRGLVKAACCNLGESFETNPSVDVSYTDAISGAKQIKLLGLEGSYTQMLTERIPNLRGLASSFGLNYIPGPWMNSISISKGAASVIDGYESITGQINVEYKKPENHEPTYLNLYANQMGRLEGNFNASHQFSDRLSTMLFASGNFMNNKVDLNNDTFLDVPLVKQVNLFNRWKYHGDNFESMSGLKYMLEDRNGGQENYFPDKTSGYYGTTIKTNRLEAFTKNGFVFDGDRFRSLGTMLSFIHHNQESMFGNRIYNGTQNTFFANVLYQSSFDAPGVKQKGLAAQEDSEVKHKYIVGLSYNHDEYDEHLQDSLFRRVESVPGIYAEYTMAAIENLSVTGGLRADFHNLYGTFITPRFHAKYNFSEGTVMRVSAGKGYHIANIFAENIGIMASSRKLYLEEELKPEIAWNYGINGSHDFPFMGLDFTLNAEYYYTSFVNQVIIDLDRNPGEVHVYNLKGDSYSHSFQVDLYTEIFPGFELTTAYRLNDVKMTIGGALEDKPLMSNHKAFVNMAYTTPDDEWAFDFTAEYNGSGRIPNTSSNPEEYRLNDEFPAFIIINAQVTKKFGQFELYFGGENLTNYRQPYPILAYNDPFGKYFDSSMIWGPVAGVMIYSGFRWNL